MVPHSLTFVSGGSRAGTCSMSPGIDIVIKHFKESLIAHMNLTNLRYVFIALLSYISVTDER